MEKRVGKHPMWQPSDPREYEVYGARLNRVVEDSGKVHEWYGNEYVEDRGFNGARGIANYYDNVLVRYDVDEDMQPCVTMCVQSRNPWSIGLVRMPPMTARVLGNFLKGAPQEAIDKLADVLLECGLGRNERREDQ